MASYTVLPPTKKGEPRIKVTVEHGYDEDTGERLRYTKTIRMKSMSDRAIKKAITDFEIEVSNKEDEKLKKVENIKFVDFIDQWMNLYVKAELSFKTRDTYKVSLNNGIIEDLGDYKLSNIKTLHLVECLKRWRERCPSVAKGQYTVLKSIFSKAIEWKLIKDNPMDNIKSPRLEPKKKALEFYDEDQLKHLFRVLENVNPKHKIQIKLAAMVGLRLAEVAGLCVESFDFDNNTIYVDKTLQFDIEIRKLKILPPKNKKPRLVNVPSSLMRELKLFVDGYLELKNEMGNAWNPIKDDDGIPLNLIFTKSDGYPSKPAAIDLAWRRIIEKYNLPKLNFHALRHSYASFMVSRNVNFKIIQEQLGHSDIKMTINTYSHLTKRDKNEASDHFDDLN
ncbi:site-specific integrase [Lysinibacillus sp. A4]|uniref:tyrosine-type recombinase/integrase n=1 Tax=Lysinibacillus sp. A4 TaxID=2976269 RepID=UPI00217586E3|nr:site-specific integrase [Lysinibacillus sp. A4]MCS5499848.1 site-specific integrase [Lysinibacillus sp. A4]